MLGFSPEFDKNLKEGARLQATFNKDMKELSKATKEQESKVNKITNALESNKTAIDEATETGKDTSALLKEQTALKASLKEDKEQLSMMKTGEKEAPKMFDEAIFQQMNESLFKISESELQKRQDFDKDMKAQEEVLAQLKKNSPEATIEIAREEKNLELKKEKETKRREKQQTSITAKGFKGIANGLKDFGKNMKKTAEVTLKGGLLIAAYFAIAKFLQSPMFGKLLSFIKENIIPAFTAFADYFMKPGGLFDSLKRLFGGLMDIVGGIFKIITGIFTGDGSKILEGFRGIFSGLAEVIGGIGEAVFGIVVDLGKGLINLIVGVVKGIFNLIIDAITGVFNFMDNLTGGMYTNIMSTIMSAVEMFTGGFTKIFSGDILGGLADIIISPFKMIGELAANVFKGMIDTILNVVNLLPGVNIKNPFDEVPKPKSPEPPQFLKNLQGPTLSDRAEKLKLQDSAVQYVVNNNTANNVSAGGTTVQQNSTRYVKDQSSVFQSNNA